MSFLADLATTMLHKAAQGSTQYRSLGKGLQLQVTAAGDHYRLLMWRRDTEPSEREITTVRDAFGVPSSYVGDWVASDGRRWYAVRWPVAATEAEQGDGSPQPDGSAFNRPFVRIDGVPTPPPPRRERPQRCDVDVEDAWVQLQRALLAKAEKDGDQERINHFRRVLASFDEVAP